MPNMAKVTSAAITASIMPTKVISWQAAGLLGLAICLLILAVPNFLLRIETLTLGTVTEQLKSGHSIDRAVLDDYIERQQQTLGDEARAEFAEQLALGLTARLNDQDLSAAITAQLKSLSLAPANPFGWLRLAYLYYQTQGVSTQAADAWYKSLQVGPHEARLLVPRVTLGVLLMEQLSPDAKGRLPGLIREAYEFDSGRLAKAAYEQHYISVVETALADYPDKLLRFQQMAGRR